MKDLQIRKQMLKEQIEEKEEEIRDDYKGLVDTLSFRNILGNVSRDIATSNYALAKAFTIGKLLIERRKKRKQLKKATGNK